MALDKPEFPTRNSSASCGARGLILSAHFLSLLVLKLHENWSYILVTFVFTAYIVSSLAVVQKRIQRTGTLAMVQPDSTGLHICLDL